MLEPSHTHVTTTLQVNISFYGHFHRLPTTIRYQEDIHIRPMESLGPHAEVRNTPLTAMLVSTNSIVTTKAMFPLHEKRQVVV